MDAAQVMAALQQMASAEDARQLARFFKTGVGQYGEGDQFIGVRVPQQRRIARSFAELPLTEIAILLQSAVHEHRLTALLILLHHYQSSRQAEQKRSVVDFYRLHLHRVNSWDLVDLSAPKLLGDHLLHHPAERVLLQQLIGSPVLWLRRVAILATWPIFKAGEFAEIIDLSTKLLTDPHDLMHKATGWMLRELGKVDPARLHLFLQQHAPQMPRTMLRYAIERLPAEQKQYYK
ncbi:MAG: DNA alkylation repair protein [Magnetococcales bacterium]|nr:DNA alkylation repair protein [Magnetococcales bacterium]